MRSCRLYLLAALLIASAAITPSFGQDPDPAPPATKDADPVPVPVSPDVTEVPLAADFLVVPLRVHILSATDLPSVQCGLTDDDIARIVGKVNGIWHKAGVHWALGPIVREAAADQDKFRAEQGEGKRVALPVFRMLAPEGSKATEGVDVYYIHAFSVNGVFLGDRTAFVQETAKLRPVPGGIDEPLPRVTAHELGHALGLPHRQDRTNLLASGTTGTLLNQAEVDRVRSRAPRMPGMVSVPDLEGQLKAARDRHEDAEVARLAAILAAIPAGPVPAQPAADQ